MFGQKVTAQPKQARRRHGVAFYVIGGFTAALEMMLGINAAFLADQSVSLVIHNLLDGTLFSWAGPLLALIISLLFGLSLMLAGLWTFSGFISTLNRAKGYARTYTTWDWPQVLCWTIVVGIMGIDFSTLMFRAGYFVERGSLWLLVFFGILIPLVWVLGMFLHVLDYTPRDTRQAEVRMYAEALEADDLEVAIKSMDPDLRTRVLNGDLTAYDEHWTRVEQMRAEGLAIEQARVRGRRRRHEEVEENAGRPLLQALPPQQRGQGRA